jgi:hypothetical protein
MDGRLALLEENGFQTIPNVVAGSLVRNLLPSAAGYQRPRPHLTCTHRLLSRIIILHRFDLSICEKGIFVGSPVC